MDRGTDLYGLSQVIFVAMCLHVVAAPTRWYYTLCDKDLDALPPDVNESKHHCHKYYRSLTWQASIKNKIK